MIDKSWYIRPTGVAEHISAGGIVVRAKKNSVRIALIREGSTISYVLPKGHVEPGETPLMAAQREIEEEAGLSDLTLLADLGTRERLDFSKRSWKITHYFVFLTMQVKGKPTDPQIEYHTEWFRIEKLPDFFWPEQKELIESHRNQIATLVNLTVKNLKTKK